VRTVPTTPTMIPAAATALGMAKIPVPKELFSKCTSAPENLETAINTRKPHLATHLRIGVFHISVFVGIVLFLVDGFDTTNWYLVLVIG
jgi:hypothetical protein